MSVLQDYSLEHMELMAAEAYQALPKKFRDMCGHMVIRVENFPTKEVLDGFGYDDPYELLGLFRGVGLPQQSAIHPPELPNMVFLYRAPILEFAEANGYPIEQVVSHVLVHEIGHHFGFSDDDMEALERKAKRNRRRR